MGGLPAELDAGPGRLSALVKEKHLREVITESRPRLVVGAGDGARCPYSDRGRLSEFCDRRLEPVPDHAISMGRILLEGTAEEVSQVGHVHSRPVLLSLADHDQISGVISW